MGFRNRLNQNSDLDSIERYVGNHLRFFISLTIGLIIFVGIIALAVFFVAVRGAEQTLVPDVRGKELTSALLELQEKELYPRIQLRYSQSSSDRGLILEQNPNGGTIVKAGRRIRLVVSQGVIVNNVGDYVGRTIDEVRMDLQTLSAAAIPLLSLKEPFMYQYSPETPGTILQQSPLPGTPISGPIAVEFVISRGLENELIRVPKLTGLSVSAALELIEKSGIRFIFSIRSPGNGEKTETVVRQTPDADTLVPVNHAVSLELTQATELKEGEVFGLFSYTLPNNPYPLPVSLEARLPSGDRRPLITVNHPGGTFTIPYHLPGGSTLVLSILNREIYREEIALPVESLTLDQL
jgi:beta-lactam-binding protein with PASTA domain